MQELNILFGYIRSFFNNDQGDIFCREPPEVGEQFATGLAALQVLIQIAHLGGRQFTCSREGAQLLVPIVV
ncbi:MAG: hypothetical protein DMG49_14315 [Acidobacteria bacterium]|nr:MAG: hypothetical protein DMG49_14315 [Acidobacteriota bacterium]